MPRISGTQRGEGVQAVVFALQILEYLAQQRSTVGVTDYLPAVAGLLIGLIGYLGVPHVMGAGYVFINVLIGVRR